MKYKTVWFARCARYDFETRCSIDRVGVEVAAKRHQDETGHYVNVREKRIELCGTHPQCLEVETCPNCHAAYPLTRQAEPTDTAYVVALTLGCTESQSVRCDSFQGRTDRLYACGCRSHDGHVAGPYGAVMAPCKAHRPLRRQTHILGRCYVCAAPLTKTAQAYQRKLDRDFDALFPVAEASLNETDAPVDSKTVFAATEARQ